MSEENALPASPERRAHALAYRTWGDLWRPSRVATAPGRIELLGNHLDYNGGPVLAAAIDREVCVVSRESGAPDTVEVVFGDQNADFSARPQRLRVSELADWRNPSPSIASLDYVRGAIASLASRGHEVRPSAQMAIAANVPIGLGVSSSAALCVALVLSLARERLAEREIVLAAQEAEHRAGTPCGTMDQSASVAGGVILFDAQAISYQRLSPELGGYVFAVVDSGVDRSLGASAYPVRVRETAELLRIARQRFGESVRSLCSLSAEQGAALLEDPDVTVVQRRRLTHLLSETQRVHEGTRAIADRDWHRFGQLMSESGRSSATDYDVSHPQVEELVAILKGVPGVLGARMMGGGGGGSALALMDSAAVPTVFEYVTHEYYDRHGLQGQDGRIHICQFGPGASCREESA